METEPTESNGVRLSSLIAKYGSDEVRARLRETVESSRADRAVATAKLMQMVPRFDAHSLLREVTLAGQLSRELEALSSFRTEQARLISGFRELKGQLSGMAGLNELTKRATELGSLANAMQEWRSVHPANVGLSQIANQLDGLRSAFSSADLARSALREFTTSSLASALSAARESQKQQADVVRQLLEASAFVRRPGKWWGDLPDDEPIVVQEPPPAEVRILIVDRFRPIILALSEDPAGLYQLPDRDFEELTGDLFAREGFDVEITQRTRDGGRDILITDHHTFGEHLYVVECKRNGPQNPVGVDIVRKLRGVQVENEAVGAMIVTTSRFTGPAKDVAAKEKPRKIVLRDFGLVAEWITRIAQQIRS